MTTRRAAASAEAGFTMIITIGVLLVTSMLMVAAFVVANGDVHLSHVDSIQKQAYYAALAGVQNFEYHLEKEPNYWQTCEAPSGYASENESQRYEVKLLAANGKSKCETSNPFESMIESKGAAANSFRIEAIGCAGKTTLTSCTGESRGANFAARSVIATFKASGFLQYVYFTRYEDKDPVLYSPKANCEKYYEAGKRSSECTNIQFISGDNVNGPMHTDDTAQVCGTPEFGRPSVKYDKVEINGGTNEACSASPVFNTESGKFSTGRELIPPASDESLLSYVESTNKYEGVTQLVLEGSAKKIKVTNNGTTTSKAWPANGLIYVKNKGSCGYAFTTHGADTSTEKSAETNCGNVYVKGTYGESLTIAAENDLIVNGNTYPTSVSTLGQAPTGTAVLGLIATRFVRIYHPVEASQTNTNNSCSAENVNASQDAAQGGYGWGTQENIWIYAAILSTKHSFTVDNYNCGNNLGELNVYGAIAQNFRGVVGQGSSGYIKNYNYDERLATDEPPYFLQPLNTGWEVARETSPTAG